MKTVPLFVFFFAVVAHTALAQIQENLSEKLDLRGNWLFSIGDETEWSRADFDDTNWETVPVPSAWENEGYPGYDGYAWYRFHFELPPDTKDATLYLKLGRIDDVDEVYFNGFFVGSSGRMPEHEYKTSYNTFRQYIIAQDYLNAGGENVIAVRVYDERLEGGILEGDIGLFGSDIPLTTNLSGIWQFRTGDDLSWKDRKTESAEWADISVPGCWEPQGYTGYDGFAWYRKAFYVSNQFEGEELVLLLGKIDDMDEAFINGELVGSHGNMFIPEVPDNSSWLRNRAYTIPDGVLQYGGYNILTIRVYDNIWDGGIYEGHVGIIRRQDMPEDKPWFVVFWEQLVEFFDI